jgi:lipopolysaccharide/colanic/teichoic acid biosynthesis glycosyltransferase
MTMPAAGDFASTRSRLPENTVLSATSAAQAGRVEVQGKPVGGYSKRVLDVALILMALPLLGFLMLGLALLIKGSDKGPVL